MQENHHYPRVTPPHGACFQGHHMVVSISPDQQKADFKLDCHSNESLLSIKHKVARRLNVAVDHVTMGVSDRWLDSTDNNKLVGQLEFGGNMAFIIKTYGGSVTGAGYKSTEVSQSVRGAWVAGMISLSLIPLSLSSSLPLPPSSHPPPPSPSLPASPRLQKAMPRDRPWLPNRSATSQE